MIALPHHARAFQIAAFLTPPIAVLAPRGLAIALPVAALAAVVGAWRKGSMRPPPTWPTITILAFLAWGAASAFWAIEPHLVWSAWGQIAGLALPGLLLVGLAQNLEEDKRHTIGMALALGLIVALTLLAIEWASGRVLERPLGALLSTRRPFEEYFFNRGAATLAILVWPAAFALCLRWGWKTGAALIAATLLIVAQFESMAAIVGLLIGTPTGLLATWRPRLITAVLAFGIAVGVASSPLLPHLIPTPEIAENGHEPLSISHRLQIWRFVAERIAEHPIAGWGLNASRELPGGTEEFAPGVQRLPLHPHNAFLQWWLELGFVGAALGTLFVLLALRGAAKLGASNSQYRRATAAALALVGSSLVVAAVGYGIWQAWWMAELWLAAVFMAAIGTSIPKRN